MSIITILFIAVALSMDSFAVSISNGISLRKLNLKNIVAISFSLAFFQAIMPLIGWFAGVGASQYIEDYDHWVAFALLAVIGGKMIYEGFDNDSDEEKNMELKVLTIIGQSIATSIDALAVGISFAILNIDIISPILIIGLVTFIFSITGLYIGKAIGNKFSKKVEIIGGIVLIAIGIKIVIEHIYF